MNSYLDSVIGRLPQVLSQVDREFFSPTYGCGDRVYWCWKFTDAPGARFQEYVYTLCWLHTASSFDNPWQGNRNIKRILESGFAYWAQIQRPDGSFDEAYPVEHSLAATAFTVFYLTEGYELLKGELAGDVKERFLKALDRAGAWLCENDEKHGVLSNHLSAAAAALYNAGAILGQARLGKRAGYFVDRILENQSSEGWYREYGGADIGYQTHGSFYLARLWQKTKEERLLKSLTKANAFLWHFVHPDGSVGGEYASRNTMFYFPAAYEMLSCVCPCAAATAVFEREKIARSMTVGLQQMDAHNLFPVLNNYIFAHETFSSRGGAAAAGDALPWTQKGRREFPEAGLVVERTERYYAVVGAKKGGVLRIWDKRNARLVFQSSGYVTRVGRAWFSSQVHGTAHYSLQHNEVRIHAPFTRVNQKVFSPWSFILFRLFTLTIGRYGQAAYWVKRLLVKVLVTKQRQSTFLLARRIVFGEATVSVEDSVSDPNRQYEHCDKFCTFHMGSSRYVHMDEELTRGEGYMSASLSFDHRGVLQEGKVVFK